MISMLAKQYLKHDKEDEAKDIKKYGKQAKKSKGPLKKLFSSIKKDETKHHKILKNAN